MVNLHERFVEVDSEEGGGERAILSFGHRTKGSLLATVHS